MRVCGLKLKNFRNYSQLDIDFSRDINILVGHNAQGKTNIVEAIYLTAIGKSHRGNKDNELIKWQEDFFKVNTLIERDKHKYDIDLSYSKERKKRLKINGVSKDKLSSLMNYLNVVLFSPEELELIKGGPALRRRFLDVLLSQISPKYFHALQQYSKIINQRNAYLRELKLDLSKDKNLLEIWDMQLSKFGAEIVCKRVNILKQIVEKAKKHHLNISDGKETIDVSYISFFEDSSDVSEENLMEYLYNIFQKGRNNDIKRGHTLNGPHRDDLKISINNYDARIYASQGQQRSLALALKMAELECLEEDIKDKPVLLLDDVMSELDEKRRYFLLTEISGRVQTFITTTDLSFINIGKEEAQIFQVDSGCIIK